MQNISQTIQAHYAAATLSKDKIITIIDELRAGHTIGENLSIDELRAITSTLLKLEGSNIYSDIENLIAQKELIESQIAQKTHELQNLKYSLFDILENQIFNDETNLEQLHKIKIESLDLLEILDEIIQSAIITTLEKNTNISQTLREIVKDITYQSLNASVLNATRIRHIIATILQSAISVCEASPNHAQQILDGTFRGIDDALYKTIEKFHQYLLFAPEELKVLYKDEYKTIEIELDSIESLYKQIIGSIASTNHATYIEMLYEINRDLQSTTSLSEIAQKTLNLLRNRLDKIKKQVSQKRSQLLQSRSAQEAKAIGSRAWSVAKNAVNRYKDSGN